MPELKRTTPCNDCPWRRRSAAGWLGADDPVPFLAKTHRDELDMPCHVSIDYSDEDWRRTQLPAAPLCAGALIYLKNTCKLPRDAQMREGVAAVERSDKVFARPAEFLSHHLRTEITDQEAAQHIMMYDRNQR